MIWRTDKPTEDIILAQLSESFSGSRYALLGICHTPYEHYHEDGEEVPFFAIEKWASLKEDETNSDLEKVFRKYANDNHTETTIETSDGGEPYDNTEEIYEACRYGAERMREQMMKDAIEVPVTATGMRVDNKGVTTYADIEIPTKERLYPRCDKVKVIIVKE